MQPSPLQLKKYFIKELEFSMREEYDPEKDTSLVHPEIDVEVSAGRYKDDPLEWRFEVSIKAKDKQLPSSFKIVMLGFFNVVPEYPSEKVQLLAQVNGPAILYSAAREILMSLTSRSGHPPILLPSVTFLPERSEETTKKRAGRGSRKTSKPPMKK